MKIVVLGSGGRLGAALARVYAADAEVIGFNHAMLDIGSREQVEQKLSPLDFDVLINCAAQTNVDRCETHPEEAMQLNAEAVRQIAEICTAKRVRCVHISTDYVFDGEKTSPYGETDEARPISVYGESKLRGEEALLNVSGDHLAVRVSWVFGPDRPSFVDQLLQRALESEKVEAIADKFSTPSYTLDIAAALRPLLRERVGGLLHLANAGECSWRDYGQWALDCAIAAGAPMKAREVGALKLADLKAFVARRPVYTVLATDRFTALTGHAPRDWRDAVQEHVRRRFAKA